MEEIPKFLLSSEEKSDDEEEEDKDKDTKKSKSLTEKIVENRKKSRAEVSKNIAKSLFESKDREDSLKPPEQIKEDNEDNNIELSQEDEKLVNKSIAIDHLENPIIDRPMGEPVVDFLEQVIDGSQPEEAFNSSIQKSSLNDYLDDLDNQIFTVDQDSADQIKTNTRQLKIDHNYFPNQHSVNGSDEINNSSSSLPTNNREILSNKSSEKRPTKLPVSVVLASSLSSYFLGKEKGQNKTKKQLGNIQKKLETKIQEIEKELSQKEIIIQNLYLKERSEKRYNQPPEKTTLANNETRLNLKKPHTVEHLGKVIITKEHPETKVFISQEKMQKPNNIRQYYRPEHVRTMRRQELMAISSKITVEGASLKHMYDNGLFSERALRRLVVTYLKDQDMLPKLRKEIIEKQLDYERDPLLKDSYNREDYSEINQSTTFFNQMLSKTEIPISNRPIQSVNKKTIDAKFRPLTQAKNFWLNILFIIVITFLISLIMYLLLKK